MSTVLLLLRPKWLIVVVCDSFKTESLSSVASSPDEKEKGKKKTRQTIRANQWLEESFADIEKNIIDLKRTTVKTS